MATKARAKLNYKDVAYLAACLASKFSRERHWRCAETIAEHSIRVAELAADFAGLPKKLQARAGMKELEDICLNYGATVVRKAHSKYYSLGLRFPTGTFADVPGDVVPLILSRPVIPKRII